MTTDNWYAKQQYACQVLRQQAQTGGLDCTSLDRCLATVLPAPGGELAMVPVGAYLVANGSHDAWIIVCCWEYPPTRVPPGREMRHVRAWALAAVDATVIAQLSCG